MAKTPVGRNAPCPCGSGKRFKHCCLLKAARQRLTPTPPRNAVQSRIVARAAARRFEKLRTLRQAATPQLVTVLQADDTAGSYFLMANRAVTSFVVDAANRALVCRTAELAAQLIVGAFHDAGGCAVLAFSETAFAHLQSRLPEGYVIVEDVEAGMRMLQESMASRQNCVAGPLQDAAGDSGKAQDGAESLPTPEL